MTGEISVYVLDDLALSLSQTGSANWGADHSTHALKKDCNWLDYIHFKLEVDPFQEKEMTRLRHRSNVDELLRTQSRFLQITEPEVIIYIIKFIIWFYIVTNKL